jgi:hypothetical protein
VTEPVPPSPPLFSKDFAPDTILAGGTSTLSFAIDNSANVADATALDFTDNLPAGVLLTASAPAVTCAGGTLTAVAGTGIVTYTGGTASSLSSCIVSVEVTSSTPGTHVNITGDLTSSFGSSGTATDTLSVGSAPGFSKAFAPAAIETNEVSTLTFTVDNSAGGLEIASLLLNDSLPAGVVVAAPPNASTTCTGGSLTAVAGSSVITYTGGTVAAASTCTVSVDVTAASAGTFANTATLSSAAGGSPDATDTLTVSTPVPSLGPWGLLVLAVLLLLLSAGHLTRRSTPAV